MAGRIYRIMVVQGVQSGGVFRSLAGEMSNGPGQVNHVPHPEERGAPRNLMPPVRTFEPSYAPCHPRQLPFHSSFIPAPVSPVSVFSDTWKTFLLPSRCGQQTTDAASRQCPPGAQLGPHCLPFPGADRSAPLLPFRTDC